MHQNWIDPVFFSLGPVQVHWYGFMYVFSFVLGGFILRYLAKENFWPISKDEIDKFTTWIILGMFFGARLTYVFVYNWEYYSEHLGDIFSVWKGGLSFHGAALGMCIATWIFTRVHKLSYFQILDCLAITGPQGLLWGRIGNFINGELYGRVTDSWVGVVFPGGGPFPRHASQLYEAFLEGLVLTIVVFYVHRRQRFYGVVSAVFIGGYGIFRFFVEFFREPDPQLGYYFNYFTMGQLLCLAMLPIAFIMLMVAKKQNVKNPLVQQRQV